MAIKEILEDFAQKEQQLKIKLQQEEEGTRKETEQRILEVTSCFETVILPAVYSVETDLQQGQYWYKITISQIVADETDKPCIREVFFYFYPERTVNPIYTQKALDNAYKGSFTVSGDYRSLSFSMHFPRKLPPITEKEETIHLVRDITKAIVDIFLEKFIKGSIEAYLSDRVLL